MGSSSSGCRLLSRLWSIAIALSYGRVLVQGFLGGSPTSTSTPASRSTSMSPKYPRAWSSANRNTHSHYYGISNACFESSSSSTSLCATVLEETPTETEETTRTLLSEEDADVTRLAEEAAATLAGDLFDSSLGGDDDYCEADPETGLPVDPEVCLDEEGFRKKFRSTASRLLRVVRVGSAESLSSSSLVEDDNDNDDGAAVTEGELLERGWESRGRSSALRRNAEVWKFALKFVLRALEPRKLRKKGAPEAEVVQAQTDAALFLRDGLLRLGPTFVKLGQVCSTRTDVLPKAYTEILKTLQDDVPGFSGARARAIVARELGMETVNDLETVFPNFSEEPLAAASLGQVHTASYTPPGTNLTQKVAIKVQRAGLKDLFDVDLKNLKKLAALLDKFDPKTDGADRNWVSIYEESERLLYLEIDYTNEADNAERFARDFLDVDYVRVPKVYREVSTPRVLTMEFVVSFKLTDIERIQKEGLDRQLLAKRTADAFLRQIVETGYFHCDPHPGNLCVDATGNLVYYDFGMMDSLKPKVRSGFRKFCRALFEGGPTIDDATLATNAKALVEGVAEAGVLSKTADRLAVEKLARYFMRTFKNKQLGKSSANIKGAVGTDLQTLTENNVFRFPSTFTFIFRSFASVDGIGKGLDPDYDLGKLAQPFVDKFIRQTTPGDDYADTGLSASQKSANEATRSLTLLGKATGLNLDDIKAAVTSPRKVAYVEETLRSMEDGSLKIRVRSLENEKILERMQKVNVRTTYLVLAGLALQLSSGGTSVPLKLAGRIGAAFCGLKAFMTNLDVAKFDKTQLKFVQNDFEEEDDVDKA